MLLRLLLMALLFSLSACSNMLFFPLKQHLLDPKDRGVDYRDIYIETDNNQQLHGWLLPEVGDLKGTVLFFHGNGENISTHIGAVYWLPENGYRVILVDYRGYGKSKGSATLNNAITDIRYSIHDTLARHSDNKPVIVFGQSIGASMSVYVVATSKNKKEIDGLVLIAPFSDYQKIASEALSKSWLTWLFQVPLSWTINNDYKPTSYIGKVNPVPLYFIHGTSDNIISSDHSVELYELAKPPKKLYLLEGDHNRLAATENYRKVILDVLQEIVNRKEG